MEENGRSRAQFDAFVTVIIRTWPPPAHYGPHLLQRSFAGVWDIHPRQNGVLLLRTQQKVPSIMVWIEARAVSTVICLERSGEKRGRWGG